MPGGRRRRCLLAWSSLNSDGMPPRRARRRTGKVGQQVQWEKGAKRPEMQEVFLGFAKRLPLLLVEPILIYSPFKS
jgi:hypothetical protein